MHLAEGIVPMPTLVAGAALTGAGTFVGLRKMDDERVIHVAVLSSALFVASLIHVPIGPVPVHLVLNGLAGIILGWALFPAYLTALLLQALFFGYGGITTLGVNTAIMATPGLLCHVLFAKRLRTASGGNVFLIGAATGALSIACSCAMLCVALMTAGREFLAVTAVVFGGHFPVAIAEAIVTGSVLSFLMRVRPETFGPPAPAFKYNHEAG
jgi:cobalt/nickel transport system permease protein